MTWPGGGHDQGQGQPGQGWGPPGGQYQGSYPPPGPYQSGPADPGQDGGAYGGPQYDPNQYGTQVDPAQYGQQGPYGQHGQQPGGPGGPRSGGRKTGLIVGLAVLGVILVLGVVAGVYFITRDTGNTSGGSQTTTASPSDSKTSGAPSQTGANSAEPDPVVPGWQVATSGKRKLAYDVPPDWKVIDEETIIGFEDAEGPKVGMSGASTYKDGYCAESDSSHRAAAGFSGYKDTDLNLVASDAAGKWGRYGYLGPNDEPPQVDVGPAAPITVNGIKGAHSAATVRVTVPAPCAPPAARVHAVAVPAPEGSYVFVIFSDQDVPDALPDDQMLKIINTVRAAEG